jgi:hypothetical protein
MNFRKLSTFNVYTKGLVDIAWKVAELGLQMASKNNFTAAEVKQLYDKVLAKYPDLKVDSNETLASDAKLNLHNIFPFTLAEANKIINERPLPQKAEIDHPASG